jgi:hypothetical protein
MNSTRRALLTCVGSALVSTVFKPACAAARVPICSFSIHGGWSDTAGRRILARTTDSGDQSGIPQIVSRIENKLGFSADIEVLITRNHEDNAFATLVNGRKFLVVDTAFVDDANRIAGTDWAAIEIIAHEIGHHIAGFADDSYVCELNADYWSGQALQRLGAGEDATKKSMLAVGDPSDTATHPNKYRRADIVAKGWADAKASTIDWSHCERCRG